MGVISDGWRCDFTQWWRRKGCHSLGSFRALGLLGEFLKSVPFRGGGWWGTREAYRRALFIFSTNYIDHIRCAVLTAALSTVKCVCVHGRRLWRKLAEPLALQGGY